MWIQLGILQDMLMGICSENLKIIDEWLIFFQIVNADLYFIQYGILYLIYMLIHSIMAMSDG